MTPEFLSLPGGKLAYQRQTGPSDRPSIVFLGGYASDMTGTKASFLAERSKEANLSFLRFDYSGTGQSDGDFKDGTIGRWQADVKAAFAHLTQGPQIVIGSSMGGWLGLLQAMIEPASVKALIGIAAAPDFTEDLIWPNLSPDQKQRLQKDGLIYEKNIPPDPKNPGHGVPLTLQLIEEARAHLLLRSVIPVHCPVRLLQGLDDRDVPWQHALQLTENLASADVRVSLIKNGDHRLSRDEDLALLWQTVGTFL